jgi:nucleotide-binding universal stress UspA family protein
MTVVCVPDVDAAIPVETRRIGCIVAATDLSPHGNAAVSYALSIAPPDSRVIVVYVEDHGPITAEERARVTEGLSMLTSRREVLERRVEGRIEILESDDPARSIVNLADEQEADLICVASRGRSRLPRFMLGSVAQSVLLLSQRPVLIIP